MLAFPSWRLTLTLLVATPIVASCKQAGIGEDAQNTAEALPPASHTIIGAGATFPNPLYTKWALAYYRANGVGFDYDPVGSKAGLAAVRRGEIDFAASDIPLSLEELERDGLVQFPMIIGGVAPVVNIPGIAASELTLTADLLAEIYLGRITRWSDAAIAAVNPGLELPDREITPIYRADSSGTAWLFTHYLSVASPKWRDAKGAGVKMSWLAGVGAKSNAQVARFVGQFKYTLGYLEFSHAKEHNLTWVTVRNRADEDVAPGCAAFAAAVENAAWATAPDLRVDVTDRTGAAVWPITGASYILVEKEQKSLRRARELLRFFYWAYAEGSPIATELNFVAIPRQHLATIEDIWRKQIRAEGSPGWL